ncbi:MAG: hypothetical protein BWY63_03716 [Chloroflexi bacterium ADurb.Bin360]|nr:MAG: hypothetical protein BWY63_03716 [Chloroflexi bacterium ADurb.Bin360]
MGPALAIGDQGAGGEMVASGLGGREAKEVDAIHAPVAFAIRVTFLYPRELTVLPFPRRGFGTEFGQPIGIALAPILRVSIRACG